MFTKLTIGIPNETYRILKSESAKRGLSMAEFIRRWLEYFPFEDDQAFLSEEQKNPALPTSEVEVKSLHPILQENNILLRKIARYTNSQIVIETDEQLKALRGKGGT